MKITFIILTWNRYKFLEICLQNLVKSISNFNGCEIIIMDNGSDDATYKVLEKYENFKYIKIIKLKKNYGLNAYKKLISLVNSEYTVIVDDDVLSFPEGLDLLFTDYMVSYPDYGFIALNVIQNEFTNGAKPPIENYREDVREYKIIEQGPTGGWCTCFRMSDYKKIKWRFLFSRINMKVSEDGMLSYLFSKRLKLKSGLIKNSLCFHASGPHYAKEYGHLDREIEKYANSGMKDTVKTYQQY